MHLIVLGLLFPPDFIHEIVDFFIVLFQCRGSLWVLFQQATLILPHGLDAMLAEPLYEIALLFFQQFLVEHPLYLHAVNIGFQIYIDDNLTAYVNAYFDSWSNSMCEVIFKRSE